jgi:hypothetical protein
MQTTNTVFVLVSERPAVEPETCELRRDRRRSAKRVLDVKPRDLGRPGAKRWTG